MDLSSFTYLSDVTISFGMYVVCTQSDQFWYVVHSMYPEWVEILAGPWKMEGYLWLQAKGFLNAMIVFRISIFA